MRKIKCPEDDFERNRTLLIKHATRPLGRISWLQFRDSYNYVPSKKKNSYSQKDMCKTTKILMEKYLKFNLKIILIEGMFIPDCRAVQRTVAVTGWCSDSEVVTRDLCSSNIRLKFGTYTFIEVKIL